MAAKMLNDEVAVRELTPIEFNERHLALRRGFGPFVVDILNRKNVNVPYKGVESIKIIILNILVDHMVFDVVHANPGFEFQSEW